MAAFQQLSPVLKRDRSLSLKRSVCRRVCYKLRQRRPSCCATPEREQDSRGYSLPEPGEIVLTPGRWADEDGAGLVEGVRYMETRGTHVVDVIEMRRVAGELFALGSRAQGTSSAKWYDIADVRLIPTPEYISSQDAYRIRGARDGYAKVQPLDERAKQEADAEYAELKQYMLKVAGAFAALGTIGCAATIGVDAARAFAYGGAASVVYLFMLQGSVDIVGEKQSLLKKVFGLRYLVPAIPFILLAKTSAISGTSIAALKSSIPKREVGALLVGLLSYKVPVLLKTGVEFVDGLAAIQPGTSGMLGTVASLTARSLQRRRDANDVEAGGEAVSKYVPPVIIFAGPSGAGKSTLMSLLETEYDGVFGYSVSHTTRGRRDGEIDGKDYFFVDDETFERMTANGEFVEYAKVHGRYYGTSFAAVNAVLTSNKGCILDLDIQGIESVRQKEDLQWTPRLIWVAPPSLETLRERLLNRGTETDISLKMRMDTAMKEMSFAATNSIFDLTIINENVNDAYAEVKDFVRPFVAELRRSE